MALTTINSGGVKDDSIVNADIKSDAAIALSKLASTPAVLTGSTNNTITTVTAANAIQGEANLTFDGTTLGVTGNLVLGNTTQSKILHNTSDASDNKFLTINGGGDASQSRGAGITFYGNEVGSNEGRLWIGAGNSGSANGFINFNTGGLERARIDSSGRVGIGTTSMSCALHVKHATNNELLRLESGDQYAHMVFKDSGSTSDVLLGADGNALRISTGGGERMRIDSSGRLLVGHTSSINSYGENSQLQVSGTGFADSTLAIRRDSADTGSGAIILSKSRGSAGGVTIVQSGDNLGSIVWCGADGGDVNPSAGLIQCVVDGTPGVNDMPGRLEFYTTADGAGGVTERMRIDNAGRLLLGTTTEGAAAGDTLTIEESGNSGITIRSGTSSSGLIYFSDGTSGTAEYAGFIQYSHGVTNAMYVGANSATQLEIHGNSGNVKINDGDLVIGTAGHGVDFSATGGPSNNASGTSELFSDYEEGTWTPTLNVGTATWAFCKYIRIGRQVQVWGRMNAPTAGSATGIAIHDLPFAVNQSGAAGSLMAKDLNATTSTTVYINSDSKLYFYGINSGNAWTSATWADCTANTEVYFQGNYLTD